MRTESVLIPTSLRYTYLNVSTKDLSLRREVDSRRHHPRPHLRQPDCLRLLQTLSNTLETDSQHVSNMMPSATETETPRSSICVPLGEQHEVLAVEVDLDPPIRVTDDDAPFKVLPLIVLCREKDYSYSPN